MSLHLVPSIDMLGRCILHDRPFGLSRERMIRAVPGPAGVRDALYNGARRNPGPWRCAFVDPERSQSR
jgi:hypothetical protein